MSPKVFIMSFMLCVCLCVRVFLHVHVCVCVCGGNNNKSTFVGWDVNDIGEIWKNKVVASHIFLEKKELLLVKKNISW